MSDSIRTENFRNDQLRIQMQHEHDKQLKEIKEKQNSEIERLVEQHKHSKEDLEKGYNVELSTKRDDFENRLSDLRQRHAKTIDEEKMNQQEDFEKTRARYQEQIARYRENSEKILEDLKRKHDNTAELIERRAKERGRA